MTIKFTTIIVVNSLDGLNSAYEVFVYVKTV